MNYSAIAVVALLAYMWHTNGLNNEISTIKKLLVVIYESVQAKFDSISNDLVQYHTTVLTSLSKLHNMTKHSVDLILVNSRKIDVINNKIDALLEN